VEEVRTGSRTGKIVGFDFGLKTFLTASNGEDIESPLFFQQNRTLIRKANLTYQRNVVLKTDTKHD
jgi:putative transposase